ncbi:MAG: prepilin-type N-terminal cleavage/methylation domain-containing protein [Candidatus Omnitrophota bacterium]|nr:prepilin-type N-terminal cleavage/methylation domain-containing protein [Candidatus Omnitrophota bacterium]
MKRLYCPRTDKGFTLMEVVVSLFIFMIVWMSAVGVVVVGKNAASYAKHKSQAIYIAQRAIEQMRRQPFQSPNFENFAASITGPVIIDTKGNFGNPANPFMGNQIVTVSNYAGDIYRKRVQVEVNWNELVFGTVVMREYCTTDIANEPQLN